MLRRVALVRTDVSEELSASFVRVTRIGELGTTLAVTITLRAAKQFGFRADSSTKQALYKLINETLQAINSKSPTGGIVLS
jgi:hypothetical protein